MFRVAFAPVPVDSVVKADLDANVLYDEPDTNTVPGTTLIAKITVPALRPTGSFAVGPAMAITSTKTPARQSHTPKGRRPRPGSARHRNREQHRRSSSSR